MAVAADNQVDAADLRCQGPILLVAEVGEDDEKVVLPSLSLHNRTEALCRRGESQSLYIPRAGRIGSLGRREAHNEDANAFYFLVDVRQREEAIILLVADIGSNHGGMAQPLLEVAQAFLAEVEIVIAQCEGIVTQEASKDQLRLSLEENREGGTGESISRIQEEGMGILLPNLTDQG
jgi:hypothetical protein